MPFSVDSIAQIAYSLLWNCDRKYVFISFNKLLSPDAVVARGESKPERPWTPFR